MISPVPLATLRDRLRLAATVLLERTANVLDFFEGSAELVPANVKLVSTGID